MNSLKYLAAKGVKWTAVSAVFATATAPIYQIIKARFLTPEEFAYLSILMLIIGLSRNLEAAGFNRGVIQKDEVTIEEASSLLFFNLFISAVAAGIIYLIGPSLALFFDLPRLHNYMNVLSIAVFLQGPAQFFMVFLEKQFCFKTIAVVQVTRQFLFVFLGTVLIISGWGVLGFILGHLFATALSAVLFVHGAIKYGVIVLKPYFHPSKVRPFIRFGIMVTGRQALNTVTRQIDELIILHFLGPDIMGVYYFGKNMLERLRQLLDMSYNRIIFPLLSRLKNDKYRLSGAYYKMTHYISMVAFPAFVGISLTAHLFVPVLFGKQWLDSIIVFQVFSIILILKILTIIMAGNLLYSVNRPGTVFAIDLTTDLLYVAILASFASQGIEVVLFLYSVYQIIKNIFMQYAVHRHLSFRLFDYFSQLKSTAGLTSLMALVVWGFQNIANLWLDDLYLLIGSIVVGSTVYFLLIWQYDRKSVQEIKGMMLNGTIS